MDKPATVRKVRMSGWNAPAPLVERFDQHVDSENVTYASVYEIALVQYFDRKAKSEALKAKRLKDN